MLPPFAAGAVPPPKDREGWNKVCFFLLPGSSTDNLCSLSSHPSDCLSLHWMQPSLPFPVSLFFLLVRVALKIRSLRIHPPRLCLFAVFFIQTVYKPMIFLCLLSQTDVLSRGILISTSAAQEQDGSHGSAGCRAPDQHQHRRLPLPTKKRWRPSSNLCAPHILSASCTPHFHLPVTECREWP